MTTVGGGRAVRMTGGGWARVWAAEAAGAALLVALSGVAAAPGGGAVGAGLTVAALVHCFVAVSGAQMNPAVTLAALVWGRAGWRRAALEWSAQAAGAVVGAAVVRAAGCSAVVQPAPGVGGARALALEALGAAVLAVVNCAAWAEVRPPDAWPLRVGATVAALSIATAESGACLNPARAGGPALVEGAWRLHWVYWAGPLGGAALAALLHRLVFTVERRVGSAGHLSQLDTVPEAVEMSKPAPRLP